MLKGEEKQATAAGRESPPEPQGTAQSYWRGERTDVNPSAYGAPGYGAPPSDSVGMPYYKQSSAQGFSEPYYSATAPDNVDFLTRQADVSRAVYSKDHVAAGLLAIFLGGFGIHKFYLGYNQAGFIMLAVTIIGGIVSFGLAALVVGVIALIEGIIYLTKSQSEFDRTYVLQKRDWF